MGEERRLPDDPLDHIKRCVRRGRVLWTYHVNMRMAGRAITRQTVLSAVDTFEVIESNPEDKYLPSYLVLGWDGATAFHALFAADVGNDNVRAVTVYYPKPEKWSDGFRTRRP